MILNINRYDEVVRTLRLIQEAGFQSAVIAGGAVRDIYFDLMFKDIDVFVWDPRKSNESVPNIAHPKNGSEELQNILRLNPTKSRGYSDELHWVKQNYTGDHTGGRVSNIWNVVKNFIPYQIILTLKPPVDFVNNHFDLGICKAYCDGTKFRYTPDFMRDAQNKCFTVVAKDMTEPEFIYTMHHHIPAIQHKYPGFSTRIAPWNQQLVDKIKNR